MQWKLYGNTIFHGENSVVQVGDEVVSEVYFVTINGFLGRLGISPANAQGRVTHNTNTKLN